MNTGKDEILELVKERGSTNSRHYPSRILIKFKNEEIKSVISDTIGHSKWQDGTTKANLQLSTTEPQSLTSILNIETYLVSQSWHEGSGRYSNLPTSSNGVTWTYRDNSTTQTKWPTGSNNVGATFGSSSIWINELPTASAHQLTINGVDFIPVLSSSIFNNDDEEVYVNIGATTQSFATNLVTAINASSSLTLVSASWSTTASISAPILVLSGSDTGSTCNVTVTTESITGNSQNIFVGANAAQATGSIGYSLQGGTDSNTGGWQSGTTGSIKSTIGIDVGGGTWYTGEGFNATQQFLTNDDLDINMDVTDIVGKWSGSLFNNDTYPTGSENNGFIIKHPDSVEENTSSSFGEMQYFSVDTHTIFPPKLTFKWDDSTHTYQSSAKNSGNLNVNLYRNKQEFNQNDEATFRIHVRDKYPVRQFASSSNYLNVGYFTTSSYYSVRDAYTEEEVIPFDDDFTKMSADGNGMYFKIYMKGLQPERYYRILFKHKNNDGTTIYDNDYHFKVVR